ncbi:hypothetical protein [Phenylobacterium immobile]|nr:hypothetical protein [Phenylobacterium immobile]
MVKVDLDLFTDPCGVPASGQGLGVDAASQLLDLHTSFARLDRLAAGGE